MQSEQSSEKKTDSGLCVLPLQPCVKGQVIGDILEQGGVQLPRGFSADFSVGLRNIWHSGTWIGFCLTGPISLCVDLFVCFCFILHMCRITVSAVRWT